MTRQPDYDPIARVDPIIRLPANTIITRLKKKIEGKKTKIEG
jgi:hypothetical protein